MSSTGDDATAATEGINPDVAYNAGFEDLDEDRLATDPLEEGMDPPEGWSTATGGPATTPREQREGESLDDKLAQEVPDENP